MQQEQVFENVARAAELRKIHALSVTDNPGGTRPSRRRCCVRRSRGSGRSLGSPCLPDKNRSEIEKHAICLAAEGVRNVLLLSVTIRQRRDFEGRPKPVFDIDPVNMVRLIETMNRGLSIR